MLRRLKAAPETNNTGDKTVCKMRLKPRLRRKAQEIEFGLGQRAKSVRVQDVSVTWGDFVAMLQRYAEEDGVPFTGNEDKAAYKATKASQNYLAAQFDGKRSNDNVRCRSLLYVDLDGTNSLIMGRVTRTLKEAGLQFVRYTTPGDRHALKGGKRACRFLVVTDRPMTADEIWSCQHAFLRVHGLDKIDAVDSTANERARLMFMPHLGAEVLANDGVPVSVAGLLHSAEGMDLPSESGNTTWTEEALASASDNAQAIIEHCFEMGYEAMPSGRGFAVCCPNHESHTDNDGTDGSTAILLPDSTHPEARFQCFHDSCQGLNSHQHLAMQLLGVPDSYLPEAHNISRKQMQELLPYMDAGELEYWHSRQVNDAEHGTGFDRDDLLTDDVAIKFTKRDPIIENVINFGSTFELVGASNIGKSFYLLGQMACASEGIPFAGQKVIRSHCFYFDAEGGSTTLDRKQALQKKYDAELDWLHIVDIQAEGWDIRSKEGLSRVIRFINETADGEPVGIIAFDSLNQTMALGDAFDENSAADMGAVASALKSIADATGGTAGVVHHPAKAANGSFKHEGRGSGALHGAMDYVWYIEQPDAERPLELNFYTEKTRTGLKQTPRGFVLVKQRIDVDPADLIAVAEHQSTREAPDFSADLENAAGVLEYEEFPFDSSPRDETLVLIPVALRPFVDPTADEGDKIRKEKTAANDDTAPAQPKAEKVVLATLQMLCDSDDSRGYSANEIGGECGDDIGGASVTQVLNKLYAKRMITCLKDERGCRVKGAWIMPPTGTEEDWLFEPEPEDEDVPWS